MKNKPASWGVALSNQLLKDYENLINLVKIKIRPTDWMDKKLNAELSAKLSNFITKSESGITLLRLNLHWDVLQSLQKADFSYVGHADLQGGARYRRPKPSVVGDYLMKKGN